MKKVKKKISKGVSSLFTKDILLLFLGALLLRLALSPFGTLTLDQNTFIAWGQRMATVGPGGFYSEWSDYLPGYLYVLGFLSQAQPLLGLSPVILFKLPAIIADILAAILIYYIARKHQKSKTIAAVSASFVLFNPAFISNSTLWGQVDIFSGLLPLISIYLINKNWFFSAVFLALGAMVKPQAALAAPIVLWLMMGRRDSLFKIVRYVLLSGLVFILAFVPFAQGENPISFAISRLSVTMGQYPYGSVNAFNLWGLWGFWQPISKGVLNQTNIGYFLFVVFSLVSIARFRFKSYGSYLLFSLFLFANFLFFTKMHERHLLPALLPLALAAAFRPILFVPLTVASLAYCANMFYAYNWVTFNFVEVFSAPVIVLMTFSLLATFFWVLFGFKDRKINLNFTNRSLFVKAKAYILEFWNKNFFNKEDSSETFGSKTKYLLVAVLISTFLLRIFMLGSPPEMYFDEVYHAFTAKLVKNGDVKAWEWWNPHPEGFAYEWTHPPVSKYLMAIGMIVFGENALGWRAPAAVFGTLAILLVFLIGKKMFNQKVGILSAFVFGFDGLSIVLSRMGMNDIYLVTFLLLTFLLFANKKYLLSSVVFGLAIATKWSAFWFLPVLATYWAFTNPKKPLSALTLLVPFAAFFLSVSRLGEPEAFVAFRLYILIWLVLAVVLFFKKRFRLWSFALVPFLIYTLSYLPQFMAHGWDIFWGMQRQMWWYHMGLEATHPFTSPWWSWPFMSRPIWLYTSGTENGLVGNIYAMGNPAVFWAGLVSLLVILVESLTKKDKRLLFVFLGYAAVFVPWALSPRIMFLYHYFPALPFLCLSLGWALSRLKKRSLAISVATILVVLLYFYPHLTGLKIPVDLSNSYYWLPGWR